MDTEKDVRDTMCTVEHLPFYQQAPLNEKISPIYSSMVRYGVLSTCVPKTYLFPEICALVSVYIVSWKIFCYELLRGEFSSCHISINPSSTVLS